jgi:hypothetical protein
MEFFKAEKPSPKLGIFLVGTTVSRSSSIKFFENKEQQQVLGIYPYSVEWDDGIRLSQFASL